VKKEAVTFDGNRTSSLGLYSVTAKGVVTVSGMKGAVALNGDFLALISDVEPSIRLNVRKK